MTDERLTPERIAELREYVSDDYTSPLGSSDRRETILALIEERDELRAKLARARVEVVNGSACHHPDHTEAESCIDRAVACAEGCACCLAGPRDAVGA